MSKILLLITFLIFTSCSHSIHLVHVSDFEPYEKQTSGKKIESLTEQFVVLGFSTNTNYVDKARKSLIAKCTNGDIQGITTRYSTSHGFFSYRNKIFMQAICIK